ncbi:MAG TPA: hypothetical protein VGV89_01200 [Thermoplasmata archaeon]|nr:hypothetical protein [Thermoplasmata archaeon]
MGDGATVEITRNRLEEVGVSDRLFATPGTLTRPKALIAGNTPSSLETPPLGAANERG